jgi:hypothetical protein
MQTSTASGFSLPFWRKGEVNAFSGLFINLLSTS